MIDLTKEVLAGLLKLKDRLHLEEVPCDWNKEFRINTVAGPLRVRPMDDWLACHFEDIPAAIKHLPTHDCGGHLNPYSGKWNWHWFDHVPSYCQEQTRLNMTSGVENMLEAFAKKVEQLLVKSEPQTLPG
jgi:hypothetical protein